IKGDNYIAQKERVEANLQSAKATLSTRQAELDKINSDYERAKELHNKGLSSDAELEAAKSNYLSMKGTFESAKANVLQGEASVKEITDQINKLSIYSPMDGTVSKLNVELGERVLGSGFSQGTNIMTVSDLSNMEAVVDIDENDVVIISVGDTARVKVDAFGNKVFRGIVKQIGNSAQSTGLGTQEQVVNFEVEIKLIDLDKNLRPGMSCNADIETETKKNVVSVPIQSVTARSNIGMGDGDPNNDKTGGNNSMKKGSDKIQEIVFVVDKSKAKKVEVSTGISDDNYIEITKGLSGGEEVVSGSYRAISRELEDSSTIRKEDQKKSFSNK
ncbi:MAG: efflux RND transporter periplasmic adaptor subunit, partial [Ignavibacteriaceae bacterium]